MEDNIVALAAIYRFDPCPVDPGLHKSPSL